MREPEVDIGLTNFRFQSVHTSTVSKVNVNGASSSALLMKDRERWVEVRLVTMCEPVIN